MDGNCAKAGKLEYTAPTKQRVVLAGILLLTLLVAYLDRVNVSVLIADPNFIREMGIEGKFVEMGLLMTVFIIAYGISNVLLSPIGDMIGPRKAMSLSIILWAISLLIGGFTSVFTMMLVSRFILGIGEGMHWPMQSKFVKNWFPPQERGKANAVWLVGLMIGPALAMPFFTWVVHSYGWRPSFFMLATFGLVPLLLLWFYTSDHPRGNKRVNEVELEHIEKGLRLEAEAEAKNNHATVWESIKAFIYDYRFWLLTLNYCCIASIWWGTMAWLPSYLKVARGFSWAEMGAWASLPYILGTISVLAFGYLSDKFDKRAPFAAAGQLFAALGLYFGSNSTDNFSAVILISLGIASIAVAMPVSWALLQRIVPSKAVGAGAGMMNGVSNIASAFVPVSIGYFIAVSGGYLGGLMFLVSIGIVGFISMTILSLKKY